MDQLSAPGKTRPSPCSTDLTEMLGSNKKEVLATTAHILGSRTVTCALALSPTTHRTWGDCPFLPFSFLILAMRELMTPEASTALRFWAGPSAWTWMDFGGT